MKAKIEIKNLKYYRPLFFWDFRVDRLTPLGNPFQITAERDRYCCCKEYNLWFNRQLLLETKGVLKGLRLLEVALKKYGKLRLFCWCAPKQCHAETIKKYLLERI